MVKIYILKGVLDYKGCDSLICFSLERDAIRMKERCEGASLKGPSVWGEDGEKMNLDEYLSLRQQWEAAHPLNDILGQIDFLFDYDTYEVQVVNLV